MKNLISTVSVAFIVSLSIWSCKKTTTPPVDTKKGYVLTMSNSTTGNELVEYTIASDGSLSFKASVSSGGTGNNGGLGSQGAVTLSTDKKFVFVVNAGDGSVSSFTISTEGALALVGKYSLASTGTRPISVTQRGGLVYVLSTSATGSVTTIEGFTLNTTSGVLSAIPGSLTMFPANTNPAQISFVLDKVLVISERATNLLTSYVLNAANVPANRQTHTSQATQPFGFIVGTSGRIYVTEAAMASSVSSYTVSATGVISNINTVNNGQGGACWAVVNNAETLVYATNTGSNTISSFNINSTGNITGTQIAVDLGTGNGPIDAGITAGNEYVYTLAGASDKIFGYRINGNTLTTIPTATMFVPGAALGLAIY